MDQFQHCFVKWVTDLHDTLESVVAIDGKTLRRSFDTGSDPEVAAGPRILNSYNIL